METKKIDSSRTLVVVLHAFNSAPGRMEGVRDAVVEAWPEATVVIPPLPLGLFSLAKLDEVVAKVLLLVDALADAPGVPFTDIVFVGHSMGALIARKVYVAACGETERAPLEPAISASGARTEDGRLMARPWAKRVSRIVLLAGMNRGWRVTHHLGFMKAMSWTAGAALEHVAQLFGRSFVIFGIRQGAGFITQLRVQWLRMRQAHAAARAVGDDAPGGALTVQLLGSRDDMVAPEDNVDLVSGGDFCYLDVPYSGHADVIDFHDPIRGAARKAVFLEALTASENALKEATVTPSDDQSTSSDAQVRHVLFVIHGIRDLGYWTHKIARRVKHRAGPQARLWATETSSYGYFPMLPFLLPWTRRKKVEWLMDQYTEALSRYPHARFSYVGHSNGTYLLAKALELYPCCQFRHVTFAGSVVSRRYDWLRAFRRQPAQVEAVLNFTASSDWVVAWFPKFFQVMHWQDLGSAGHDGFPAQHAGVRVYERGCVLGGHGAALDEGLWDVIADFTISGKAPDADLPNKLDRPRWWVRWPGYFPPVVWTAIGLLVYLGWLGAMSLAAHAPFDGETARGFVAGLAAALYVLGLWKIVTRL